MRPSIKRSRARRIRHFPTDRLGTRFSDGVDNGRTFHGFSLGSLLASARPRARSKEWQTCRSQTKVKRPERSRVKAVELILTPPLLRGDCCGTAGSEGARLNPIGFPFALIGRPARRRAATKTRTARVGRQSRSYCGQSSDELQPPEKPSFSAHFAAVTRETGVSTQRNRRCGLCQLTTTKSSQALRELSAPAASIRQHRGCGADCHFRMTRARPLSTRRPFRLYRCLLRINRSLHKRYCQYRHGFDSRACVKT